MNKATGQVCRPAGKKRLRKKLRNINQNGIDYCKLKTCTYINFVLLPHKLLHTANRDAIFHSVILVVNADGRN